MALCKNCKRVDLDEESGKKLCQSCERLLKEYMERKRNERKNIHRD